MRSLLLGLGFLSLNAYAQSPTAAMTCGEAYEFVWQRQTVSIPSGEDAKKLKLVAHEGYCAIDETAEPEWQPARDEPNCFVGFTCRKNLASE